jgi:hypothetical protein
MLNPSTADEDANDPTIRRCIKFSQRWGFDGMDVVNLFSWRATDPLDVRSNLADAANTRTDDAIRSLVPAAPSVVVAWGRYTGRPWVEERATSVLSILHFAGAKLECLGRNADGSPKHPLYVAAARERQPFPFAETTDDERQGP